MNRPSATGSSAAGRVVGVLGLLLAVAACGSGAPEQVVREPASRSASGAGAASPWDPGVFLENPCRALTAEQLLDLGIASGTGERQPEAPHGPTCRWSDRFIGPTDSSTDVTFPVSEDSQADARGSGGQERELRPVGGRPTVATVRTVDVPEAAAGCDVTVEVAGDEAVLVHVATGGSSPFRADVCARAVTVTEHVLATVESNA